MTGKPRYYIDSVQPIAGGYSINDRHTGRRIALVWSRRLARLIRDWLNTWDAA